MAEMTTEPNAAITGVDGAPDLSVRVHGFKPRILIVKDSGGDSIWLDPHGAELLGNLLLEWKPPESDSD